jgi:hypothetical protein
MKTWKNVALASAILAALSFSNSAEAGCKKEKGEARG